MRKLAKFLGVMLLALLLVVAVVLAHAGLFTSIVIEEQQVGPYTVVYQEHRGSYYRANAPMQAVAAGLKNMGIATARQVGIYYDDPGLVTAEELRSEVGVILEAEALDQAEQAAQQFGVKEIPAQDALVVEFPIGNLLSYIIAPAKVYREVNQVWASRGYPEPAYSIEIYDAAHKTITYIMPVTKQGAMAAEAETPPVMTASDQAEATHGAMTDEEMATEATAVVDQSTIIAQVTAALATKLDSDPADLDVSLSQLVGDYAQGGVRENTSEVGGGMWLAAKVDGEWQLVWDGNGAIYCDDLVDYPDFPTSIVAECYDEFAGEVVAR